MTRPFLAASLSLAMTIASSHALGQDDPRKAQAAPYFEEGHRLAQKGKNAESLEKFRKAHSIYPSPNTLFNIARQEHVIGKKLDALRDFREALKNPVLAQGMADQAKTYIAELEQALGHVKVVGPDETRVTVAGAEIVLPHEPLDVEPGPMVLIGSHAGASLDGRADVLAGKLTTIELVGPPTTTAIASPPSPPPVDDHPPPAGPEKSWWTTGHIVGVAGWVLGAGAIAVGAVFTSKANSAADEVSTLRSQSANPDSDCSGVTSSACSRRSDAESDRVASTNVAIGAFVSGGVLLVGGTLAYFLWPGPSASSSASRSAAPRIVPLIDARTTGVSLTKEF